MSQALLSVPKPLTSRKAPIPELAAAKPVLKWAGGKSRLLNELLLHIPEGLLQSLKSPLGNEARYFEPFSGGAALFFKIQPLRATLSDANEELVNLYRVIQGDLPAFIEELQKHPYDKEHYYMVRAQKPEELSPVARAARMMYLNRTCFNGLWRVNKKGEFNVPFGSYNNPTICHHEALQAAKTLFKRTEIKLGDFEKSVSEAKAGDFVYFDPPYVPISATASFTAYTGEGFGLKEQERLAELFSTLTKKGVYCMLSNSDVPLVKELYRGHRFQKVFVQRSISRKGKNRAIVSELLVTNY